MKIKLLANIFLIGVMMVMVQGPVDRATMQSYYQSPPEVYDDAKTEAVFEILADYIDGNYAYAAGLVNSGSLSKMGIINTNDYDSIQAALNAAETNGGGIVVAPDGTHSITAALEIPSNVMFMGTSWNTIIKPSAELADKTVIKNKNNTDKNIVIRNLTIDANNLGSAAANTRHNGIVLSRVHQFVVDNVKVVNCTGYGIWTEDTYPGGTTYSQYGTIRENYVENCQVGIEATNSRHISWVDNTIILTDGRSLSGLHPFDGAKHIYMAGNRVTGSGDGSVGIDISNATDIEVGPNIVNVSDGSGNTGAAIVQAGSSRIHFTGGEYNAEDYIGINLQGGDGTELEDITFNGVRIDGYSNGLYSQYADIRVVGSTIVGRGPASGGSNTYGIFGNTGTTGLIDGNTITVEGESGFEYPVSPGGAVITGDNKMDPDTTIYNPLLIQSKVGQASIVADGANGYANVSFKKNVTDWTKVQVTATKKASSTADYSSAASFTWINLDTKTLRIMVPGVTSGTISYEIKEVN